MIQDLQFGMRRFHDHLLVVVFKATGNKQNIEDAAMIQQFVERERIFEFLVGLNGEVDEERRIAMLDSPTTENSAFVTIKSNGSVPYSGSGASNKTRRNEQTNQDNLWCAYCKSQDIPRRIVENLMENCHSSLEEIVVTEMLNLDNRMDKSTLCILNTTLTGKHNSHYTRN
ncbi:hypothetical protein CK203_034314 [Vitis vinifera]|uniref:Uncharacterized protein n=1 Tax=Vitis vinifera TaxID=29760 RepID=A0A438INL7_VITVI|nr:hypothetical protein CK203_034314 [Vitis vinifera]